MVLRGVIGASVYFWIALYTHITHMVPKVVEDPGFKFCEELHSDAIKKLLIDGETEKVKDALINVWNYGPQENLAVPVIMAGLDGKFSGAELVITGMAEPKADLTSCPFYNRCRNNSPN